MATAAVTCSTFAAGLAAAGPQNSPTTESIDIQTRWLPNGLRVVTIAGPWPKDAVSIRLVSGGGALTARDATERYGMHFVEHLAFNRSNGDSDVYRTTRSHHGSCRAGIGIDHQAHQFATDAEQAKRILAGILAEWDYHSFDIEDVERERRRIIHELGSKGRESPLAAMARGTSPSSVLAYSQAAERSFVDTVSVSTLRRIFDKRFAAGRLTLVVAAHPRTLDGLADAIVGFARIPKGHDHSCPGFGNISWLSGDVPTSEYDIAGKLIGFRFSGPDIVAAHDRSVIFRGIAEHTFESLVNRDAYEYRFPNLACYAAEQEIWAFAVTRFWCPEDSATTHDIFEQSLEYLSSRASLAWWTELLERDTGQYRLLADSPDAIASHVATDVARSAQHLPAPSWADYAAPADPKRIAESLQTILSRAVIFRAHGKEDPIVVQHDYNGFDPSLANLLILDTANDPLWAGVTLVVVLLTASAGVGVATAYLTIAAKKTAAAFHQRIDGLRKRGANE